VRGGRASPDRRHGRKRPARGGPALLADEANPAAVKKLDDALSDAFRTVAAKLSATPGFAADTRDAQYLSMLEDDFSLYGRHEIYQTYNDAAAAFNQKLTAPVLGDVARLFGVAPCPLYA
jgi:hypothetical protein